MTNIPRPQAISWAEYMANYDPYTMLHKCVSHAGPIKTRGLRAMARRELKELLAENNGLREDLKRLRDDMDEYAQLSARMRCAIDRLRRDKSP